jgi:UDP-glucuronate 4-epimerase
LIATIERVVGKIAVLTRFPQPLGDVDRTYADITHGQGVLGYAPSTMLEEGMVKELEWLKKALS